MKGHWLQAIAVFFVFIMSVTFRKSFASIKIEYPNKKFVMSGLGSTILETSQDNGIPHASICGGNGRCSTCRIKVISNLNELPVSYFHVFTYSEREDTEAFKYGDIVPIKTRSKRSKMLHILSEKKKHCFYNNFINKKRPILFEGLRNGFLVGHTDDYIKTLVKIPVSYNNKIVDINLMENKGNHMVGYI